jgi:hypothetical protein
MDEVLEASVKKSIQHGGSAVLGFGNETGSE